MNLAQNISIKSELVTPNSSHCSDHIPTCIIDEPDNVDQTLDISIS